MIMLAEAAPAPLSLASCPIKPAQLARGEAHGVEPLRLLAQALGMGVGKHMASQHALDHAGRRRMAFAVPLKSTSTCIS